jgi:hypothetical protein
MHEKMVIQDSVPDPHGEKYWQDAKKTDLDKCSWDAKGHR